MRRDLSVAEHLSSVAANVSEGGIAAIRAPLGEKVKSEPLLPFLVGPRTGGLRKLLALVGAMAIYRNRLEAVIRPHLAKISR